MRTARILCILIGSGLLFHSCASEERPTEPPPIADGMNLLIITMDTTRADFISCLGADPKISPNLDELAGSGALFTRATSETNVTNPSHLTILSGLRAIDHGVINNLVEFPDSVETLATVLKEAGYATAGFAATSHLAKAGWRGFDTLPDVQNKLEADEVTDRAIGWIGEHEEDRFFTWVHYWDPHELYDPPPRIAVQFYTGIREAGDGPKIASSDYYRKVGKDPLYLSWLGNTRDPEWAKAMYAGEIHFADKEIGRLLSEIRLLGLDDETVVIVIADHGESLGEHGIYYDHKGLYEQILRIPLILRVPGLAPTRSDAEVSTIDIVPTLVELMGLEFRSEPLPGSSLAPLLEGEPSPAIASRTTQVFQNASNHAVAVRKGDWKLIWAINPDHPILGVPPQLYNLKEDPLELVNRAEEEPERVAELRELVDRWIRVGRVERGSMMHLDPETIERLRRLGYLDE